MSWRDAFVYRKPLHPLTGMFEHPGPHWIENDIAQSATANVSVPSCRRLDSLRFRMVTDSLPCDMFCEEAQ